MAIVRVVCYKNGQAVYVIRMWNMIDCANLRRDVPLETSILGGAASLDSILRTEELAKRPRRPPDYEKENSALAALVGAVADSPGTILQTLAEKVLTVLQADSAGLSLLTKDEKRFYWGAIAGAWSPHIGGGTPRNFGPCGDVLDRNVPMLFTHWEQRYPYLSEAIPLADEGLLVPFYVDGKAVGTIWAIAHNDRRKFDAEDLRLLQSMGRFASTAYQAVESIETLKSEIAAREKAEMGLRELTSSLEAQVQLRATQLRRSEAFLAEAQRLSRVGSFSWRVATRKIEWSDELYRIFEFDPGSPVTVERIGARIHPDDIRQYLDWVDRARREYTGHGCTDLDYEHRLRMLDGSVKYVHLRARGTRDANGELEYIGAVQDVTERRVSEEALGKARSELAHAARLATVAELSAAIAHEVNQPLGAVVANGSACLRWLSAVPPNFERARLTAERIVRDAKAASEVVNEVRALFKQSTPCAIPLNLNEVIEEVHQLMLDEVSGGNVSIETDLARDLPRTPADRIQLQQVIINLVRNGIEAMEATIHGPKLLSIRSRREGNQHVRVEVSDRGSGLQDPENAFKPFFTTKKAGMGMGLTICRSIIEAHRGRLWGTQNEGSGATFCFTLPILSSTG